MAVHEWGCLGMGRTSALSRQMGEHGPAYWQIRRASPPRGTGMTAAAGALRVIIYDEPTSVPRLMLHHRYREGDSPSPFPLGERIDWRA